MSRSTIALTVIAIGLALQSERALARDSGVQFSPDGKRVFVSKDVGTDRFAITLNTDDGTVSGNVYRASGGEPAFIYCTPGSGPNTFVCFGADTCPASPCDSQFVQIGDQVTLPASFFQPPSASAASADARVAAAPLVTSSRSSGLQISPDRKRTFVSKDVGTERWAITQNDDGSVTGNVFKPDAPAFIYCSPAVVANTYDCFGADACTAAPCGGFTRIGEGAVFLPPDFFIPADAIVGAASVSDDVTEVLDVGIGVIPSAASAASAAPGPEACRNGGTVSHPVGSGLVVFDECQVNKLVCSGTVARSASGLNGSLECHHDQLRKRVTLSINLVFGSGNNGRILDGTVDATLDTTGARAFGFQYKRVVLTRSAVGTFSDGAITIENPSLFFGGLFTEIDQEFDGSQFILIRKFFPKSDGTIQVLVLKLDVTTGKLTPA